MKILDVKLQKDHLEKVCNSRSPLTAIAELVWNSLDADAADVTVTFDRNQLNGLEAIRIADTGHGLPYGEAPTAFENLGGSWKLAAARTKTKHRILHGKQGQGRFYAFALGDSVQWLTTYEDHGKFYSYTITGHRRDPTHFTLTEPIESSAETAGTTVTITNPIVKESSIDSDQARENLTEQLALYLRKYQDATISYDGASIDPKALEGRANDYSIDPIMGADGATIKSTLTVIEWTVPDKRGLYLCDEHGFALRETAAHIYAPGYSFTAYVKSAFFRQLFEQNALDLEELQPDVHRLLEAAREKLRDHFRERAAEDASQLVNGWRDEDIYPFDGEPTGIIETTQRQVFDVVAYNVSSYLPDFNEADKKSKRLTFRLLKQTIEADPPAVRRIIHEVLNLPKDKQEDLAKLLERTTLRAIIEAAKVVADRLELLKGLEHLITDHKDTLKERRELHRILAENTWVFGEQFNLTVDDESLTAVLERHLHLLGRAMKTKTEVLREDGKRGIVDLMLSRRIPLPRAEEREHLVVELKRPNQRVTDKVLNQIEAYATAVANDARFRENSVRWTFLAVSNDLADGVREKATQRDRPQGCVFIAHDNTRQIYVKTWGQLIDECEGRLQFFKERLEYSASKESSLAYLRQKHAQYIPDSARDEQKNTTTAPGNKTAT